MPSRERQLFDVGGRQLAIANLDRVLYPATGTTKAEVLAYYARVAHAMLPHLRGRLLHLHRYPEGVEGPRFWQKACPESRPGWIATAPVWSPAKGEHIEFCTAEEPATILWAVNIGSLELHTSLHLAAAPDRPTALAFDLDPGPGVGLPECCEVALRVRDLFAEQGLPAFAKTSGSKGLQVYVPLEQDTTYDQAKPLARTVAELLEARTPDRVVSRVAKELRAGKVLVDWGQVTPHKSMVCAYSVRARAEPTVSTPVRWEEVEGDPARLVFGMDDVLRRLDEHGDLFAPLALSGR